jgi:prolyl-tRNA synthetase
VPETVCAWAGSSGPALPEHPRSIAHARRNLKESGLTSEASQSGSFVEELVDKSEDFSTWYVQVILKAQLADYAPVRGCMVIRPYGFTLWEHMRDHLDRRIKDTGHVNAYFPLLIPESFLTAEAEHVEGFAPEVAWVTHGGKEKLEERLAIRPTSEAIIGRMYSKWIDSHRDLPVLINQWANVMRWEKVTRLFLRTTEFLWQEGHTAHRTFEEAQEETLTMLGVYRSFLEEDLAVPVWAGIKTDSEKFAGADRTYCVEALMSDGKALQAGTSHNLGQNFAKAFDITFQDEDRERKFVWQTSWGVSTRLIGAVIMVHGDDSGLMLPPRIAPYQVVGVPIWRKEKERAAVMEFLDRVRPDVQQLCRLHVDDREEHTPGWKYNEWEMRGVPLRMEIGPRDVAKEQVVLVRRDNREKAFVPVAELAERIPALLDDVQRGLYDRALRLREENTRTATSWDEFKEIFEGPRGFVIAGWDGEAETEAKIKEETKATIRLIPLEGGEDTDGLRCIYTGNPARYRAVFARAY